MLTEWLLTPPAVFIILLATITIFAILARTLAIQGEPNPGKNEPYACGQDVPTGKIQPNYDDFFQFAFLFTILEVVALMLGTVTGNAAWFAVMVLSIIVLALFVLLRRD
ncbi:MAG: NADH-quinone oxidoreductase subunit A [Coriobacteriales bacterium]|jgi:NADH:ubiquinone oxidoreductase subunit 3 (subunit A)|nr:NADH-quinone oxidoreductase subunit A [Coriobacteriales bacterium]